MDSAFKDARVVRLRGHHGKYLIAGKDRLSVSQNPNGSAECAKWTIEHISSDNNTNIRLKSCYGKYLTASTESFLLGATGRKVIQTLPQPGNNNHSDSSSSVAWKPIRVGEGKGERLKLQFQTAAGNFLRANGGPPPYRNSITHDTPLRSSSQDYIVWLIEIVETKKVQMPLPTSNSKPRDGAVSSSSAKPPGPTNRPGNGNTPGQQKGKPGVANPVGISPMSAFVAFNVLSTAWDIADGNKESTDQIPTATSQPENGEGVAGAEVDGEDAGGDVPYEGATSQPENGEGVAGAEVDGEDAGGDVPYEGATSQPENGEGVAEPEVDGEDAGDVPYEGEDEGVAGFFSEIFNSLLEI